MMNVVSDAELERKEILKRFRNLLKSLKNGVTVEERKLIRKAFNIAVEAHKDMRRKTGEPYIYHPLAVAQVCVEEIGLGTTSIVCALLHDVVEDTDYKMGDIERIFGHKEAAIIDGLTKISGIFNKDTSVSIQAENLKKIILTMSDDVRAILIKLADRLHNMRTLDAMPHDKQLKVASETLFLFAPLAHRLGLHTIKTELEDLSMKYTEPQIYHTIYEKLKETSQERDKFVRHFITPIKKKLAETGINCEIYGRSKSISSIWEKMKKKNVPFEEVFDLFAIRIIIDSLVEDEKIDCWRVYTAVTETYKPNPERLRDWISIPKANGYEALHTTVMSNSGKWVEVQIRTKRMDEIAEKGYAAHWKYKESVHNESGLDKWLSKIRELLQSSENNALDFLDDFKMNLFTDEVLIYTPKGELRTLPQKSTVLDFAYAIHTQLGNQCIGAKVNHNLVSREYQLKNGDQVEILTSDTQKPNETWLNYVATLRAKYEIKDAIKMERKDLSEKGKKDLHELFNQSNIEFTSQNISDLRNYFKIKNNTDLYYDVAISNIGLPEIKEYTKDKERGKLYRELKKKKVYTDESNAVSIDNIAEYLKSNSDTFIIGNKVENLRFSIAKCCSAIPGDEIIGFWTDESKNDIIVHRTNCANAIQLMSTYSNKIVNAKWYNEAVEFLAGIQFAGIDKPGILNKLTNIISVEMHLNIHSISFSTSNGLFEGVIKIFVDDINKLNRMIENFRKIDAVKQVYRIIRN